MVRFRYLLSRTKLNRLMLAWKVQIRRQKVQRLQYTIASHGHYKRVLREAVLGWRSVLGRERSARNALVRVVERK